MFGAICGDIIGSYYERHCTKEFDFPLFHRESCFTDDTVMSAAVCDVLLSHSENKPISDKQIAEAYALHYRQYYRRYPQAGFGLMFAAWAKDKKLYKQNSYGNGAAMHVVPIAYAFDDIEIVQKQAKLSAIYTHNHKEAITGAKAVASAVYLAKHNYTKDYIKDYITTKFKYDLSTPLAQIKKDYVFDSRTCYSVPPAIMAFLESDSYEDAVRKAISLGGDADTMACIAGGIAEAFYKNIPENIKSKCWALLDIGLKTTIKRFCDMYPL